MVGLALSKTLLEILSESGGTCGEINKGIWTLSISG